MSLFTEEDKIFEAWKKVLENSHLVTDGIVDEKKWLESSPKILFVLKEANHKGKPHSASLSREWLYDGAGSNTLRCGHMLSGIIKRIFNGRMKSIYVHWKRRDASIIYKRSRR